PSSRTRSRRWRGSIVELDRFGLRLPLLGGVPHAETQGDAVLDPRDAVRELRHVEEERLALAVADEAEALLGEEAVDDAVHPVASADVDPGVRQDREG